MEVEESEEYKEEIDFVKAEKERGEETENSEGELVGKTGESYQIYIGKWVDNTDNISNIYTNGGVIMSIDSIENNTIQFEITKIANGGNHIAGTGPMTAIIKDQEAEFMYKDSFENEGEGHILFKEDKIVVIMMDTKPAENVPYTIAMNVTLVKNVEEMSKQRSIATNLASDYIFPNSNSAYLDKNSLYSFSLEELELGRNEIFARHGRIFKDERIKKYFESKSWYRGEIPPEEYDANMDMRLNEYERVNIETIKEVETIKKQKEQP